MELVYCAKLTEVMHRQSLNTLSDEKKPLGIHPVVLIAKGAD
jgi:hypothetical protein